MKLLLINFIGLMIQSGKKTPPPPKLSEHVGYQPDGPKLPIDGEIWVLIVIGLIFGIYMIYRNIRAINKAS